MFDIINRKFDGTEMHHMTVYNSNLDDQLRYLIDYNPIESTSDDQYSLDYTLGPDVVVEEIFKIKQFCEENKDLHYDLKLIKQLLKDSNSVIATPSKLFTTDKKKSK